MLSLNGMLECKLCCEHLLLLHMADMVVSYVEGCVVSSALMCISSFSGCEYRAGGNGTASTAMAILFF